MCCILIVWTGCSTLQAQSSLEVGTLWHVASQKPVSLESLEADILEADVVFIGEEHYTPSHIEAAISVLDMLVKHQRHPGLAMEMLSWDGQAGLDRYINHPEMSVAQFLEESRWKENWDSSRN